MTKSDIINIVAEGTGMTKVETAAVVDGFFATAAYALANGDRVDIRGFGSFKVVKRKARKMRNPQTKEIMDVPEYNTPVFKVSKNLKEYVNKQKIEK